MIKDKRFKIFEVDGEQVLLCLYKSSEPELEGRWNVFCQTRFDTFLRQNWNEFDTKKEAKKCFNDFDMKGAKMYLKFAKKINNIKE
jgi:hypothetical protein